jgi:hypothetical protein
MLALDKLSNLAAYGTHHFEQASVGLLNFMAEEFKYPQDFGPQENGEAKGRMQAFSSRGGGTRKICIFGYVCYPNRPRTGPDPAGQTYSLNEYS